MNHETEKDNLITTIIIVGRIIKTILILGTVMVHQITVRSRSCTIHADTYYDFRNQNDLDIYKTTSLQIKA